MPRRGCAAPVGHATNHALENRAITVLYSEKRICDKVVGCVHIQQDAILANVLSIGNLPPEENKVHWRRLTSKQREIV